MEKNFRKSAISVILFILCLLVAMILCGSLGYVWAKNKAPRSRDAVTSHNVTDEGIYAPLKRTQNLREVFSDIQNVEIENKNDFLVISEGNLVNLYVIGTDGNKTFERILEIDKNSLTDNDQSLLEQGIILDTEEDLLSLLEDYTS